MPLDKTQQRFLELAVIHLKTYDEIAKELNVDRKQLSQWWDGFKVERLEMAKRRDLWKRKCKNVDYHTFAARYDVLISDSKCTYCGINEKEIEELILRAGVTTKRLVTRGRHLEIERVMPNEEYDHLDNLALCCYWCNNAKSDEFTADEFLPIGKLIGEIWQKRLARVRE